MKLKTKNIELLAYVFYGLLLAAGFLYYRFPSEAFGKYLQRKAQGIFPACLISFESIAPCFPPGFTFQRFRVASRGRPDMIPFSAERVVVKPRLGALFQGRLDLSFRISAYQGLMEGTLVSQGEEDGLAMLLEVKDIHIDDHAYLSTLTGRTINGRLAGTISYTGPYVSPMEGRGLAKLEISDGSIGLSEPILGMDTIEFSKTILEFALKKRVIDLIHADLIGQKIRAIMSGSINLVEDFFQSRISLKGTIEPLVDVRRGRLGLPGTVAPLRRRGKDVRLDFVISGTLRKPRFRITG